MAFTNLSVYGKSIAKKIVQRRKVEKATIIQVMLTTKKKHTHTHSDILCAGTVHDKA